jgi:tetratricopeptide (TPR) repeat protein/predicted Ser/Thr protein kinase
MPDPSPRRVEELFELALDLEPARLAAFLDEQCGGNPELRAAVEEMLRLDRRAEADDSFLRSPLARSRPERDAAPTSLLPTPPAGSPPKGGAPPASPLPVIARYRVARLLGEGGMGTVYEAEQDNPRRTVALKVLRPGLASESLLKRFAQEAQILGRLHHPGIAQVYDAGVAAGGQPYFAMELIAGVPLDRYAREQGLDALGRLELVARVCDAVQHAHERGVIHRDLKPSNILVDEAGQPKVLDFGVARATDADLLTSVDRTRTGQVIGTLNYMSPEQVAADPRLDRRSDVYTLGVILFELLAGRRPYPLEHLALPEAARVIRDEECVRLGSLDTRCRGDIETIAAKALEKDRDRRYPSAAELAADIRRHLRNEPIRARPPSALYQLAKFARRHKALVTTSGAFLAVVLVGGAVTAWQAVQLARAERDQAVRQAANSRDVHEALAKAAALREQARSGGEQGKWTEARAVARRAEGLAQAGPVDPGLAERVGDLLHKLDEEEADRRLVARLEEIRLLQAEVNVKEGRFAMELALPEYRRAFAGYGLRAMEAPAAAARIRGRPPAVRGALVAALDHWLALARQEKAPEAGWLGRVLAAADRDAWRQRLRVARGRKDRRALERLARDVDVAAQPPQALFLLDEALRASGSRAGAVRLLERAQDAHPGDFWINENLGRALSDGRPPRPGEAIRFLTAAVALRPRSPGARLNLGFALLNKGRLDDAVAVFQKVIALRPDYVPAYHDLGVALLSKDRPDKAARAFRKVTVLRPEDAQAHYSLGLALCKQGDLSAGADSFLCALALNPRHARACDDLGNAFWLQGEVAAAAVCFRRAVRINPGLSRAHYNLGNALWVQGDLPGAAACFRRALRIDPQDAEAHCNLGHVLLRQGELRAALAAFRTGHDLGSRRKDWPYPSPQWIQRCEAFIELEGRLPALLKGEKKPAGVAECLDLGDLCRYKKLHDSSVRFFREAFAADPSQTEDLRAGHRYRAACSAALAGCGRGAEAARLGEARRGALRRQALEWLRADLAARARHLEAASPQERPVLAGELRRWQIDSALAGVRNPDRLAKLPAAERAGWQKLWADVAAPLAEAGEVK